MMTNELTTLHCEICHEMNSHADWCSAGGWVAGGPIEPLYVQEVTLEGKPIDDGYLREIIELRHELLSAKKLIIKLAERITICSELLAKRAEQPTATWWENHPEIQMS